MRYNEFTFVTRLAIVNPTYYMQKILLEALENLFVILYFQCILHHCYVKLATQECFVFCILSILRDEFRVRTRYVKIFTF